MVLKRITSQSSKYIDQPVVSHFGQQRLFVIQGIFHNESWGGIQYLGLGNVCVWRDVELFLQLKSVFPNSFWSNKPFQALGGGFEDSRWKLSSVPIRVDNVPHVLHA